MKKNINKTISFSIYIFSLLFFFSCANQDEIAKNLFVSIQPLSSTHPLYDGTMNQNAFRIDQLEAPLLQNFYVGEKYAFFVNTNNNQSFFISSSNPFFNNPNIVAGSLNNSGSSSFIWEPTATQTYYYGSNDPFVIGNQIIVTNAP